MPRRNDGYELLSTSVPSSPESDTDVTSNKRTVVTDARRRTFPFYLLVVLLAVSSLLLGFLLIRRYTNSNGSAYKESLAKFSGEKEHEWWQKSPIYEVYPKSFKDSDGDGVGDLKGLESKLSYLKDDLGIKSVWLTPIYKSPMVDNEHDVEDFFSIDPALGTMEDFDSLLSAMNDKGMNLIMDFIPNHTNSNHTWFHKSENKEPGFEDFYVWKDSKADGSAPTNWVSYFGGSAWEYSKIRKQWYLHQFYREQPDLNVRNEKVVEELKKIMKFWLDKGVSGFRMDAVSHLFEDVEFRDEERSGITEDEFDYKYLNHTYTFNQPEVYGLLRKFRQVLDSYTNKPERVMITEAKDQVQDIMKYYGNASDPIAHFSFNFELIRLSSKDLTGTQLKNVITNWMESLPKDVGWANWVLGNHDNPRVATRFGEELVDAMNMIIMLLPGTAVSYYGEELGMNDTEITGAEVDPFGRDPERTPMQWNGKENAEFTNGTPWLPVNKNYPEVNAESQTQANGSHLRIYQELVKLREEEAALFGKLDFPISCEEIFSFTRIVQGSGLCVIVNFSNATKTVDLSEASVIPEDVTLRLPTDIKGHRPKLNSSNLKVEAKKGIVLTFLPKSES